MPAKRTTKTKATSRTGGRKIRVAIIGVGNCASSLVQGVHYYRNAKSGDPIPGIMHVDLGGYHIRDVEFVAAFDVDKNKVGKDLADAIYAKPNNTYRFADVPKTGVKVSRGMTLDGLGKYLSQVITKAPGETDDIVGILKDRKVDVVVSYLPVGSEDATRWYVEQVLQAGCAFVNCIPVFIGREPRWQKRFAAAKLPIIGDDIKSQVGATITHRVLTRLFMDRGVRLDRTYQLNFGGNTDFLNMLERERLESKKISKLNAELKLEVWDSPNSAGVVIDAIRCCKLALDRGLGGTIVAPSAYFMKSPPRQIPDDRAREGVEEYIKGRSGQQTLSG